ncbi:hypothetical protein QVD17_25004 [Tagetes erecta]|uniref:Uncharacterized protein n=1 Tax=Tagetes erecta TaxID=13708 RepID=A0AAD8KFN0_TARER|nr:hypothetical protein QVD17_25004 [Tagetes erecta]
MIVCSRTLFERCYHHSVFDIVISYTKQFKSKILFCLYHFVQQKILEWVVVYLYILLQSINHKPSSHHYPRTILTL